MCGLVNLPTHALDAFVLGAIKRVLHGDHETTTKAIDAFVRAVLEPRKTKRADKGSQRDLDLLNRKIKATVAMLADPTFDGLDELKTTLAELKGKRDQLESRMKPAEVDAEPAFHETELRAWALEQFNRLGDMATRGTCDLKDRQLVAAFVDRIEVDPDKKTGVVYLWADLHEALLRSSPRGPIGERLGGSESGSPPWVSDRGGRAAGGRGAYSLVFPRRRDSDIHPPPRFRWLGG